MFILVYMHEHLLYARGAFGDNLWSWVSPSAIWILGIEFRAQAELCLTPSHCVSAISLILLAIFIVVGVCGGGEQHLLQLRWYMAVILALGKQAKTGGSGIQDHSCLQLLEARLSAIHFKPGYTTLS